MNWAMDVILFLILMVIYDSRRVYWTTNIYHLQIALGKMRKKCSFVWILRVSLTQCCAMQFQRAHFVSVDFIEMKTHVLFTILIISKLYAGFKLEEIC